MDLDASLDPFCLIHPSAGIGLRLGDWTGHSITDSTVLVQHKIPLAELKGALGSQKNQTLHGRFKKRKKKARCHQKFLTTVCE